MVRQASRRDVAEEIRDAIAARARGLHRTECRRRGTSESGVLHKPVVERRSEEGEKQASNNGDFEHRAELPSAAAMIGAVFGGGSESGSLTCRRTGASARPTSIRAGSRLPAAPARRPKREMTQTKPQRRTTQHKRSVRTGQLCGRNGHQLPGGAARGS